MCLGQMFSEYKFQLLSRNFSAKFINKSINFFSNGQTADSIALNRNDYVDKAEKEKDMKKQRVFKKLERKIIIHMNTTQLFYSYIIINCIEKKRKTTTIKVKIIE